jgi:hypothetical protein
LQAAPSPHILGRILLKMIFFRTLPPYSIGRSDLINQHPPINMAPSTPPPPPPPSAWAGHALFHAAAARNRENWFNINQAAHTAAPTRVLRVMNPDIAAETSPEQSPKGKPAASPSTATTSGDRDSHFSIADEEEQDSSSSTSGEDPSVYYTARTSSSLSTGQIPNVRRYASRRNSGLVSDASSEEFPHRSNLTRRNSNRSRLTAEEFFAGRDPDRRDSNLVYYAHGHPLRARSPSPAPSDLGSDSSSAVGASLTENRRILNKGFDRMAAHQTTLGSIAEHVLAEQERLRHVVARVAAKKQRSLESRRSRATTEQEAMQMLVEDVPFSADGRGHCDEKEVRRVALDGGRFGLMSDSPYPRMDRYRR